MSVYLDPMTNHGNRVRVGHAGPWWCHMIADTLAELHDLAARIGLKPEWFQDHRIIAHYDLGTMKMRQRAVQEGAVECTHVAFRSHLRRLRTPLANRKSGG